MRISDWSSDVCSSDLLSYMVGPHAPAVRTNAHDALRFFTGEQIPARLRHFGPGYYEDLHVDGRTFNLLVREAAGDSNAYLLYDISFAENREQALAWGIGRAAVRERVGRHGWISV